MFTKQQFERLAEAHMDGIFRLAYSYLGSGAEADDVTQNTLLKLYLTGKRFESEAHVKNWLYRVAANECKRALLSPWRHTEDIADYAERLASVPPERSELFYAVMELPAKYRAVIHLHYYEDYTTGEIAGILGVPGATVRTRLRRGRELLKKKLMEAGEHAGQTDV